MSKIVLTTESRRKRESISTHVSDKMEEQRMRVRKKEGEKRTTKFSNKMISVIVIVWIICSSLTSNGILVSDERWSTRTKDECVEGQNFVDHCGWDCSEIHCVVEVAGAIDRLNYWTLVRPINRVKCLPKSLRKQTYFVAVENLFDGFSLT